MLRKTIHGSVTELQLDRPPANAMNFELLEALHAEFHAALAANALGIVISGREGMFSGGLDVPELLEVDRPSVEKFWQLFFRLMNDLAASPVPVAAAITGHSPAGGMVLGIHCDYRVAASGRFKMGLNEVQVGLPVPTTVLRAVRELVGWRAARRLTTRGLLIPVDEALALGLVDEVVDPPAVIKQAVAWCDTLIGLPPIAMNATRRALKRDLLAELAESDNARIATDYWFSDETQAAMRALVARLQG